MTQILIALAVGLAIGYYDIGNFGIKAKTYLKGKFGGK